jgi:ribosomal protein L11 methylase PrmA
MRFRHIAAALIFGAGAAFIFITGAAGQQHAPDVPYVRSSNAVVDAMLKLAGVKKTDVVYDLGCGDGRIVLAAAKDYGARGVGIDINPEVIQEARANARKAHLETLVKFEENDLFASDIHDATVVTLYLLPNVNLRLRPKLLKDLKPGTRVVSHSFGMGDWKPDKQEIVEGGTIYLWTIPGKK